MKKCIGDAYRSNVDIIFNPVSVKQKKRFQDRARRLYPKVYTEYLDMIYSEHVKLGEVSLYQVADKQCMMNAFCYNRRGNLNLIAFTKTLVEVSNMADEYGLTVGINLEDFYLSDRYHVSELEIIIKEAFKDTQGKVKIFIRNKK